MVYTVYGTIQRTQTARTTQSALVGYGSFCISPKERDPPFGVFDEGEEAYRSGTSHEKNVNSANIVFLTQTLAY